MAIGFTILGACVVIDIAFIAYCFFKVKSDADKGM